MTQDRRDTVAPSPQQPTQEATEDAMRRSQRLWYTRFDGKAKSPGWIITAYAEEITAATDQARREGWAQARAEVREIIFTVRDKDRRSLDWCNACNGIQDGVRALTPQSPDNAALESE